ncbi:MAG: hypothetical protein QNJ75_04805 [Acidimicrobiia bacterium]|nr:hypothetical protein [Acidimicrobiia bacterium]
MSRPLLTLVALATIILGACATTSSTTTTTEDAPLATVALTDSGLGDVLFGLDPETVVANLTARFGAPDLDSGWIPATPNLFGTCPGETMRAIGWGSLVTIFVDDGQSDLGGWFYTYTYGYDYAENIGGVDPRGLGLQTDDGIGLGTTVADLRSVWGEGLVIDGDEDIDFWTFTAGPFGFKGLLSGPGDDELVTLLEPVESCS